MDLPAFRGDTCLVLRVDSWERLRCQFEAPELVVEPRALCRCPAFFCFEPPALWCSFASGSGDTWPQSCRRAPWAFAATLLWSACWSGTVMPVVSPRCDGCIATIAIARDDTPTASETHPAMPR